MFESPTENDLFLSRREATEPLGTCSPHSFQLEDRVWPTVEHYIQAMQFTDEQRQEQIRLANTPTEAQKLGRTGWLRRPRPDWKTLRKVYMTRAVYTKCRTYSEVAQALLATGDQKIVENDQYDYYWGCGRDRRGDNTYGKVLMAVRNKLLEEAGDTPN